jgi:sugar phosphate isomerase/epimerase
MYISRRKFVGAMAAALPVADALIPFSRLFAATGSKPNSNFNGVQIGIIISPYNYGEIPVPADQLLDTLVRLGISAVEMQDLRVEAYAGAPGGPRAGYSGSNKVRAGMDGRSPEQVQEQRRKAEQELTRWRLTTSMDKYQQLRKMYDAAGVKMYAFRLANTNHGAMSDEEFAYFFKVAHVLGANQVTTELPADSAVSKRIGDLAAAHDVQMGYHNHLQVNAHSWDTALAQSPANGINLDVGHYAAAVNGSPIPFIKEHHDRITSLHLKDRKYRSNGGENMRWGQGDTPLKEILQLLKTEHYGIPAAIELEYPIPTGSTPTMEISKCLQFCREALA